MPLRSELSNIKAAEVITDELVRIVRERQALQETMTARAQSATHLPVLDIIKASEAAMAAIRPAWRDAMALQGRLRDQLKPWQALGTEFAKQLQKLADKSGPLYVKPLADSIIQQASKWAELTRTQLRGVDLDGPYKQAMELMKRGTALGTASSSIFTDMLEVQKMARSLSIDNAREVVERMMADISSAEVPATGDSVANTEGATAASVPPVPADASTDAVSAILSLFGQQPTPIKRLLLLFILLILGTAATTVTADQVKKWMLADSPASRQIIHAEIRNEYGDEAAKNFKCVRAGKLRVRAEPEINSRVIELVPLGTPVEILYPSGAWSQIRYYTTSSQAVRIGWAASSYLSHNIC
jgi:hypothetical protein